MQRSLAPLRDALPQDGTIDGLDKEVCCVLQKLRLWRRLPGLFAATSLGG